MALGMLGQKLKASHHIEADDEYARVRYQGIPHALRVEIEREARRMAGYWWGGKIAEVYLEFVGRDPYQLQQCIQQYLEELDDPRLAEIMTRLDQVHQAYIAES